MIFLIPPTSRSGEYRKIGLLLIHIPLRNTLLHFHDCSSSGCIRLFAISSAGPPFFSMRNVLWDLELPKPWVLPSVLPCLIRINGWICTVYSHYYLITVRKKPNVYIGIPPFHSFVSVLAISGIIGSIYG